MSISDNNVLWDSIIAYLAVAQYPHQVAITINENRQNRSLGTIANSAHCGHTLSRDNRFHDDKWALGPFFYGLFTNLTFRLVFLEDTKTSVQSSSLIWVSCKAVLSYRALHSQRAVGDGRNSAYAGSSPGLRASSRTLKLQWNAKTMCFAEMCLAEMCLAKVCFAEECFARKCLAAKRLAVKRLAYWRTQCRPGRQYFVSVWHISTV